MPGISKNILSQDQNPNQYGLIMINSKIKMLQ